MPTTLSPGLTSTRTLTVTPDVTADAVGSGLLPVFSTPSMIALIELAASELVQPYLDEGVTTVGTEISIKHLSATPVGMTVRAEAELTEIDGRRYVFAVRAYDDAGLIGEGRHERFAVKSARFMEKAEAKKNQ